MTDTTIKKVRTFFSQKANNTTFPFPVDVYHVSIACYTARWSVLRLGIKVVLRIQRPAS